MSSKVECTQDSVPYIRWPLAAREGVVYDANGRFIADCLPDGCTLNLTFKRRAGILAHNASAYLDAKQRAEAAEAECARLREALGQASASIAQAWRQSSTKAESAAYKAAYEAARAALAGKGGAA